MRNKLLTFLIFLFQFSTIFPVEAQDANLTKANRYLMHQEYALAAKHYASYLEKHKDFQAMGQLAQCYKFLGKDEEAQKLYKEIIESEKAAPDHYMEYAELLKHTHQYEEAKKWLHKYKSLKPEDKKVNTLIRSCDLVNELKYDSLYLVHPININSRYSDFATAFYKDGIVFLSGRPNKTSSSIDGRTGEHYLDLYYSSRVSETRHAPPVSFSKVFNSKYHEGPACFSKNQRFIYFTRNKKDVNLRGTSELSIYIARNNGKEWDKPEQFQFSGYYYSMGHPSLSPDGQYLYFISNMEGGYGGTDIYVCQKQGFGWSQPINLGPKLNTAGNEMFPFMAEDNNLYFASDGHTGLGGLDIFKAHFDQIQWSVPVNLGPPFNSSKDDFGFFINTSKDHGYFSSSRPGGRGGDDIYEFTMNPEKTVHLMGQISAGKNKKALQNVEIILKHKQAQEGKTTTDAQGHFNFTIAPHKDYSLIVRKPGYETKRVFYSASRRNHRIDDHLNIYMRATPWTKLTGTVSDKFSGDNLANAKIQVINKAYNLNRWVTTDENGVFELEVDAAKTYKMIVQSQGYFTKLVSNHRFEEGKTEHIQLQKITKNRSMELKGAHFKKGTWTLNEETEKELKNLTYLLLNNPHISIELGAYTYYNQSKKENEKICSKRAQEAANYIISKGVAPNRISLAALGYNRRHSHLVVKVTEAF